MYFLGIGIVLLILKLMQIGPIGGWSWLIVLTPFALAAAWWVWADASGYTKRKEMEKMEKRIEFDLEYIREWSLWFDIKIVFLTIFKGFVNKAAY